MNLLVIGGTRFVGRHIVEASLAEGHALTLFHRGQSGDDLFPEVERILGDRDGGLDALGSRSWDAVIDTCGYHPRVVRQSVEALRGRVGQYVFVSTVSVYADDNPPGVPIGEDGKLSRLETFPESEEITNEAYGAFKVLCEELVREAYGAGARIVRPGLVIGPWDVSDRFTYWVDRFERSGPVLVPEPLTGPIQLIDGRDLAAFTVAQLGISGAETFNAVSAEMTFQEMLHSVRMNTDGAIEPVAASESWLIEQEVKPWVDLPLWVPSADPMPVFSVSRAVEAGLRCRPLAESVRDLAAWHRGRGEVQLKTGMSRERELELAKSWLARD